MNKRIAKLYHPNSPYAYALAFIVGLGIGTDKMSHYFEGILYITIAVIIIFFAFKNDVGKVLSFFPYIIYSEIIIKGNCQFMPYLFSPYLIIVVFILLMSRTSGKIRIHSRAFVFLLLFFIIETADSSRARNADGARFLVVYTLSLLVIVLWSSFTILTPAVINKFFNNLKIASIFLCGVILVAHTSGKINYSLVSNFASTNGLEPVQISGYLGFSCAVFFLSVMSDQEKGNLILNTILLSVNSIVMLLSFSRGGLYFFGAFIVLYFMFNFGKAKSYSLALLLIPVAYGIYSYVTVSTNGVIEQRYAQDGTAGRGDLVKAGIELFKSNPVAGVGTGNFGYFIQKQGLFPESSGAHNEFVRVAAEHGILGLITYWGFFIFLFFEILRRKKTQREYAIYFLVFFALITIHNGMKISIQPLLMALTVGTPSAYFAGPKKKINVPVKKEFVTAP